MKKLPTLDQKNAAADSVEAGRAAALGLLEIFGIERAEIGDDAKMFAMREHCTQKNLERISQSLAKSRSNRKGLMSFSIAAIAAKSKSLIQVDTEHSISRFKSAQSVQIRSGFLVVERGSPVLGHGTNPWRSESDPHC